MDCETCARIGRVFARLTVRSELLQQVRIRANGSAAKVHRGIERPADFDTGPSVWRTDLVRDSGEVSPSALDVGHADLVPQLDRLLDRVRSARQQDFRATVHRVAFRTLVGGGFADVVGAPPEIAEADWRPLGRRRLIAFASVLLALLGTVVAVSEYRAQHLFFATYGASSQLLAAGAVASLLLGAAALGWLLHPRAWGLLRTALPTTLLVGVLIGWFVADRTSAPTAAGAHAALRGGELDRAAIEATALVDLGLDRPTGGGVLDELHLRRLQDAGDLLQRSGILRLPWYSAARRASARRSFEASCAAAVADAYDHADDRRLAATEEACAWLSDARRRDIAGRRAIVRFTQAVRAGDHPAVETALEQMPLHGLPESSWRPVFDEYLHGLSAEIGTHVAAEHEARRASDRAAHLGSAIATAERFERLAGRPSNPSTAELRQRHDRVEAEAAREARTQEERQRREQARRVRAETRAARAWASAPLSCCDGSNSPSCRCGDSSHRGCCSHHHGVCGCSAD